MTEAFMAYPDLRFPNEMKPIHADGCTTVLYQGRKVTLTEARGDDTLLIQPEDLTAINGFELKPEGACLDDMCIPLNETLMVTEAGRQWFNLTAFADLLGQPFVHDTETRVWSFAEIPARREQMLLDAMAPDIELTDRKGNVFRLADLKGKKALIVTWSSW